MGGEGAGDLLGGQHQSAGGVQDQVDRHLPAGHLDRPDERLGVLDVDVAAEGDPKDRQPLTAVDEGDRSRVVAPLQRPRGLGAARGQHPLLDERLQARQ
jgi:hypothetical protein